MKQQVYARLHAGIHEFLSDLTSPLMSAAEEAIVEASVASLRYRSFASPHEGFALLKEEVDEMWEAVKSDDREQARAECVQVAARALRYLAEFPAEDEEGPHQVEHSE